MAEQVVPTSTTPEEPIKFTFEEQVLNSSRQKVFDYSRCSPTVLSMEWLFSALFGEVFDP